MLHKEAAILDIAIKLGLIGIAAPVLHTVFTHTPASERADARFANVVCDVIAVIGVFLAAVLIDEAWQIKTRAEFTEH